jgi:hypothetical protein
MTCDIPIDQVSSSVSLTATGIADGIRCTGHATLKISLVRKIGQPQACPAAGLAMFVAFLQSLPFL